MVIQRKSSTNLLITFLTEGYEAQAMIPLERNREIEMIDRHELNIIVKQNGCNAVIHNLANECKVVIPETEGLEANDFVFLYLMKRIIVHIDGKFRVYTCQGVFLFTIDVGRPLEILPVAVGRSQKHLCVVSQTDFDQWVYVFSLITGEKLYESHIPANCNNGYKISALAFDDSTNTLITGNSYGEATFWQ